MVTVVFIDTLIILRLHEKAPKIRGFRLLLFQTLQGLRMTKLGDALDNLCPPRIVIAIDGVEEFKQSVSSLFGNSAHFVRTH